MNAPAPMQGVRALVFDYGNTLIEYGPRQMALQFEALRSALEARYGPCDDEQLKAIRMRQVTDPYRRGFRDNDLREVSVELVEELYARTPADADVEALLDLRYQVFIDSVEAAPGVVEILDRLRARHRLAMISNYPCGRAIRDSLARIGYAERLERVVVSGELGWVKPHPEPFRMLLDQMDLPPEACLFVGDNWLADIQGAKRAGMRAVLTTEYAPYERFEPGEGDHQPDARIARLEELETLLA